MDLRIAGVKEGEVLNELAKQLSAFSNTGGGSIIYGISDDGTVDTGGVTLSVKGRSSTKEWLEDVIPTLMEFEIVGFNVHEVLAKSSGSNIANGKGLFVIEVPDSERAPHQSKRDCRYYVRLAGKSSPAPHRLIEDIRNRRRHPLLEVCIKLRVASIPFAMKTTEFQLMDPQPTINGEAQVIFNFSVRNIGQIMARNPCLRLDSSGSVSWRNYDNSTLRRRGQTDVSAAAYLELIDPIYPGMEIGSWIEAVLPLSYSPVSSGSPFGGPWTVNHESPAETSVSWSLFADNAPAKRGTASLEDLGIETAAGVAVNTHPEKGLIRHTYKRMP